MHGSARSSSSSFKFQPPHAPLVRLSLSRWRGGSSVALFTVEARNLIKLNGFHGLLCNCPPPNYWRRNSCSNSSTTSFSTSHRPTDERTIYYLTNGQLALSFSDYVYLSDALSVDPRLSIALRCSVSTSLSFRLCLCLSLVSSAHVSFSLSKSIIILPLLYNPLFQPLLLSVLPRRSLYLSMAHHLYALDVYLSVLLPLLLLLHTPPTLSSGFIILWDSHRGIFLLSYIRHA